MQPGTYSRRKTTRFPGSRCRGKRLSIRVGITTMMMNDDEVNRGD
ncbi:hypothetical protein CGRA01v4_09279 [Colletotrichum graminicola]|nr:hypothetical protein CGRA01v4_09279 [Colletotrichum graminicola]